VLYFIPIPSLPWGNVAHNAVAFGMNIETSNNIDIGGGDLAEIHRLKFIRK